MNFINNNCTFEELTVDLLKNCGEFSCKDDDISKFFNTEFVDYNKQLLGKSYCFVKSEPKQEFVAAFTVSNSCIKVDNLPKNKRNKINRSIPNNKRRSQYPAVLVGQLGVCNNYMGLHIGNEIMDFIKAWFIDPFNKTGCRYIIVDAINHPKVTKFYLDNGFKYIFSSDNEEMEYLSHLTTNDSLWDKIKSTLHLSSEQNSELKKTRLMYFDLIVLFSKK